jgi:hypothetical protein
MDDTTFDSGNEPKAASALPGIVIRDSFGPLPRPSILAFIWGGKVRPVPQLPYGRATA